MNDVNNAKERTMAMDKQRRKECLEAYKLVKTYMGVIKLTNAQNGKLFVAAYPNLKNKWLTLQGQLDMGQHPNAELQRDWRAFGPGAFSYEVLEEKPTDDMTDVRWACSQMEKTWCETLKPYGERGYNRMK